MVRVALIAVLSLLCFESTFSSVASVTAASQVINATTTTVAAPSLPASNDLGKKSLSSGSSENSPVVNATSPTAVTPGTKDAEVKNEVRNLRNIASTLDMILKPINVMGETIGTTAVNLVRPFELHAPPIEKMLKRKASKMQVSAKVTIRQSATCPNVAMILRGTDCVECPEGQVSDGMWLVCQPCDDGTYRAKGEPDCHVCTDDYMVASLDHTKCVRDGIATFGFTGVVSLYVIIGFLRMMASNFMRESHIDFCCCEGGTKGNRVCDAKMPGTATRCSDGGTEIRKTLDSTKYSYTMYDRVCADASLGKEQGFFDMAKRNGKFFSAYAIYGILIVFTMAANIVSAIADNHIPIIVSIFLYFLGNIGVTIYNVYLEFKDGHVKMARLALKVTFVIVECVTLILTIVRLFKPMWRVIDLTVMWFLQLGLMFQVAFLADVSFSKSDRSMNRFSFGFIVLMILIEAVIYPLTIVIRIMTWSGTDDVLSDVEVANQHYISDYFGTMMAGMSIAMAIVEKTNERVGELADKRDGYQRIRSYVLHGVTAAVANTIPEAKAKFTLDDEEVIFKPSYCDKITTVDHNADVMRLVSHARQVVVQGLTRLEKEDACNFFGTIKDLDAALNRLPTVTKPVDAIQQKMIDAGKPFGLTPGTSTPEVTLSEPERYLTSLNYFGFCTDTPQFANLPKQRPCKTVDCMKEECLRVGVMAEDLPIYLRRFNTSLKMGKMSSNFLIMALLASSYFGGIYGLMEDSMALRAQHPTSTRIPVINSFVTMILALLVCIGCMVSLFSTTGEDQEENPMNEVAKKSGGDDQTPPVSGVKDVSSSSSELSPTLSGLAPKLPEQVHAINKRRARCKRIKEAAKKG